MFLMANRHSGATFGRTVGGTGWELPTWPTMITTGWAISMSAWFLRWVFCKLRLTTA